MVCWDAARCLNGSNMVASYGIHHVPLLEKGRDEALPALLQLLWQVCPVLWDFLYSCNKSSAESFEVADWPGTYLQDVCCVPGTSHKDPSCGLCPSSICLNAQAVLEGKKKEFGGCTWKAPVGGGSKAWRGGEWEITRMDSLSETAEREVRGCFCFSAKKFDWMELSSLWILVGVEAWCVQHPLLRVKKLRHRTKSLPKGHLYSYRKTKISTVHSDTSHPDHCLALPLAHPAGEHIYLAIRWDPPPCSPWGREFPMFPGSVSVWGWVRPMRSHGLGGKAIHLDARDLGFYFI